MYAEHKYINNYSSCLYSFLVINKKGLLNFFCRGVYVIKYRDKHKKYFSNYKSP